MIVTLVRRTNDLNPTFGDLTAGTFTCTTEELPNLNNQPDISNIPLGAYTVMWTNHPVHGWVFQLQNVDGRSDILMHAGNFQKDTEGCILLGKEEEMINDQEAIDNSVATLQAFNTFMNKQTFTLVISVKS